jgi:AcrR family transcriptional regulator
MKQSPVRVPFEPVDGPEATSNRRTLSKIRTRRKVLDSARALFTERGYEASTIRDIARHAGMSTGAVFANFEDKSDLFESILTEDAEQVSGLMRAAAETGETASDRLVAVFSAGYAHYLGNLPLLQATMAQAWLRPLNAEQRTRAATKVLQNVVCDVLRDAVQRNELRRSLDVRLVAELLWDAYLANYRRAVYDGWTLETLTTRVTEQVALVLAGLRN